MCVLDGRTAPRTAAMDTSVEVRGCGGGASLGEWEHNNILCVFIFQNILMIDFISFKINFLLVVYLKNDVNKPTAFINI